MSLGENDMQYVGLNVEYIKTRSKMRNLRLWLLCWIYTVKLHTGWKITQKLGEWGI